MNNAEFIDGLKRHDPAAAQHLHKCFVPSLWRFVCSGVDGDSHLAEDIVSESVLALVAAIERDVQIEHPSAWLRTVAKRRIQDHFRAAARVKHLMQSAAQTQADEFDARTTGKHEKEQERRETVRAAMAALSEEQRLVLEWKYMDRLTVREIASRLAVTEKAAESILFRARNQMRDELHRLNREDLVPLPLDANHAVPPVMPERESDHVSDPDVKLSNMSLAVTVDSMRLRP